MRVLNVFIHAYASQASLVSCQPTPPSCMTSIFVNNNLHVRTLNTVLQVLTTYCTGTYLIVPLARYYNTIIVNSNVYTGLQPKRI